MLSLAALEYHRNKVFMKVQRRILRDTLDPFDMPDERFIEMNRLPRNLALDFLRLIDARMDGDPCQDVPKTVQFCSVLIFYASGSYQRLTGSDGFASISQTLVSRCVRAYSFIIATKIMDDFIQFPQSASEIKTLHDELQVIVDFPGAFAIADGSLIQLAALSQYVEHNFLSQKGFHALNTQFVIDIKMRFLNVNARYGGSTHDSLVWRSSMSNACLRRACERMGRLWKFFMLADNGYPLQPWLLKPYDNPNTPEKKLYTHYHRKLRSLVERAIGLLKARFRCLLDERKLRYDPLMSGCIIYACSTLHNFLISNNYPVDNINPIFDEEIEDIDEDSDEDFEDLDISYDELHRGVEVRDNLAQYFMDR